LAGTGATGVTLADELRELVASGWSVQEALYSATLAPAKIWGGSDWVVLSANPLTDLGNLQKVDGVVIGGSWHNLK